MTCDRKQCLCSVWYVICVECTSLSVLMFSWRLWKTVTALNCLRCIIRRQQCYNSQCFDFYIMATLCCHIRPQATPRFCRPCPLPFTIKGGIDQELDRLESSGIIQKVPYSEWAASIITVPKKDGRYHICGDYKVTINPALDVEQYDSSSSICYSCWWKILHQA